MYSLCVGLGVFVAIMLSGWLIRRVIGDESRERLRHFERVLPLMTVAGIIGGRGLFVLYHPEYFLANPGEIVAVWHGGWVWYGGFTAGLLLLYLYCRVQRIAFLRFADLLVPGVAIGQAIGRWGNFFNQEAYGMPTALPWGIVIDPAYRVAGYELAERFHPTFLYESLWNLGVAGVALWLLLRRDIETRWHGLVFTFYLLTYGLGRFCIEYLRIDPVPQWWALRVPQWWSLALIVWGIGVGYVLLSKKSKDGSIAQSTAFVDR